MRLEEKVTAGFIIYIARIAYEPGEKSLTINFLKSPESQKIARTLIFSNIQDFSEQLNWEEAVDENCVDSLIGLDEYPQQEKVKYVVHTQEREIIFSTDEKPQVVDTEVVCWWLQLATAALRSPLCSAKSFSPASGSKPVHCINKANFTDLPLRSSNTSAGSGCKPVRSCKIRLARSRNFLFVTATSTMRLP